MKFLIILLFSFISQADNYNSLISSDLISNGHALSLNITEYNLRIEYHNELRDNMMQERSLYSNYTVNEEGILMLQDSSCPVDPFKGIFYFELSGGRHLGSLRLTGLLDSVLVFRPSENRKIEFNDSYCFTEHVNLIMAIASYELIQN